MADDFLIAQLSIGKISSYAKPAPPKERFGYFAAPGKVTRPAPSERPKTKAVKRYKVKQAEPDK